MPKGREHLNTVELGLFKQLLHIFRVPKTQPRVIGLPTGCHMINKQYFDSNVFSFNLVYACHLLNKTKNTQLLIKGCVEYLMYLFFALVILGSHSKVLFYFF